MLHVDSVRRSGRSQVAMLAVLLVVGLAAAVVFSRYAIEQSRAKAEAAAQEAADAQLAAKQAADDAAILAKAESNKSLSFFDHDISLMDAKNKAINSNKDVLLYFTASWCGPCKSMKADVFPQDDVIAAINSKYVAVYIDIDKRPDDARTYAISAVPAYVITRKGEKLSQRKGYMEHAKFLDWLNESR